MSFTSDANGIQKMELVTNDASFAGQYRLIFYVGIYEYQKIVNDLIIDIFSNCDASTLSMNRPIPNLKYNVGDQLIVLQVYDSDI